MCENLSDNLPVIPPTTNLSHKIIILIFKEQPNPKEVQRYLNDMDGQKEQHDW